MSVRTIMAAAALVAAPLSALYAQAPTRQDSAAHRTWGVNPGPVPTTSPTPTTQNPLPPTQQARAAVLADSAIVRQALAANLLEVQLGQLAQGRSANAAVQQFARRMVGDHTAMQNQWASLAAKSALPPTATLDASQSLTVRRLGGLSGVGFDRAFVAAMVQNHQQDAQAFQRVSSSAQSAEVRQLASNGLGTIQQHLGAARQLQTQIGTTDVAVAPPTTTVPSRQAGPQGYRSGNDDMKADRDFVREVAADHRMQVQLAQLAEKKARNADVKRFARQMADDFSKWQSRWDDVGARNGMSSEAGLGRLHREKVDRMEKANGKNADKAYLAAVIENIESLLPYFQKEGRDVHSSQVRELVDSELPVLRQHLAEARRLQG